MHRWFVEYNPLYLVSAALVLVGVNVLSAELVRKGFLLGQLGVPAIAEIYSWALIGGAALLMRIGLRRPAVMLALLAAFYQCDLTLHTETSMYLGWVGSLAAGLWWMSFVAKLVALCWAVHLRARRALLAIPSFAALGMVMVPRYLPALDGHTGGLLVGGWVFAVFAAGLWTPRNLQPAKQLDAWGTTVLGRSLRAVWAMWGTLFMLHVLFWCSERGIDVAVLLPVAVLLATRSVRRERSLWATVLATLVVVAIAMPGRLSFTALLCAAVLGLRALRAPVFEQAARAPTSAGPYRGSEQDEGSPARMHVTFVRAPRDAMMRLLTGSLFAAYLSAWTLGWAGGPWPDHLLALDAMLTLAVALGAWKLQLRWPLAGLATTYMHYAVAVRIIGPPKTTLQWSILSVTAGFVLLLASLAVSYLSRRRAEPR
jgi:hypothetical protein